MNIFTSKTKTIYLYFFFLIFNYIPILSNPFLPLNILEFIFTSSFSALMFGITYIITSNKNNKFSKNVISYTHTFLIIGLAYLLFFNNISFSAKFNYYLPTVICVFIIIISLVFIIFNFKKLNINYYLPIIFFTPYLIQAIAMTNKNIAILYLKYPYINLWILIFGIIVYQLVNKYKK